jgi:hypothetical protein
VTLTIAKTTLQAHCGRTSAIVPLQLKLGDILAIIETSAAIQEGKDLGHHRNLHTRLPGSVLNIGRDCPVSLSRGTSAITKTSFAAQAGRVFDHHQNLLDKIS